ncbi:hypothetical protein [Polaromonas eurypsychrophila]|uniref:hypothetical protein n=1 Tax=Polaromonas eurypsychrophila TaxID=1614635 RepID=UPI00166F519A|nr:hypothetical protein [Polaromonas eurypsychrophila]
MSPSILLPAERWILCLCADWCGAGEYRVESLSAIIGDGTVCIQTTAMPIR